MQLLTLRSDAERQAQTFEDNADRVDELERSLR
jgi:hypothetical protein